MADASSPSLGGNEASPPPAYYKFVGMGLAVSSGIFIGSSFVLKKKGLLRSSAVAGEGHAYLKSTLWWTGMIMMIVGEICNFIAYSFAPALIVTPLGALSVVVCAVLSSMVLKEKLNLHGKIGCALCIVGAVVIVLHAPAQVAVTDIDQFKHFVIQPGFLVYMCLVIVSSLVIIWKVAPKYGKKHLLVYVSVCSLIGSLSVVATQGLGAAIVRNITTGTPQFNHWFIYVTMVFVACTLLTEINYLNKALNLFNTAIVTPVYYVFFTSATLVASVILFQGFSASASSIMTVVMGFFVICAGVVLLQTSKKAALSEAIKRSRSTLELQPEDDTERILEDEKDLEPGPIGLRAVPFDSIRQMVRASTMPNSPYFHPTTPTAAVSHDDDQEDHLSNDNNNNSNTGSGFFSRLRMRSEHDLTSPSQTPRSPSQGAVMVPQDDSDSDSEMTSTVKEMKPADVIPMGEKTEYNEKDGEIPAGALTPVPQTVSNEEDPTRSPLSSASLTLRE
ncbi:magnesium transporter NIPA-domain-containing protein [Gamsiella multidivaricata]|uniref:magnesium transporter NIPA-domain-containing protein n=1 Tax=Gamsiella multidivaricata TaxID=101098 RepID=UPI00221F5680|nr:magnesium transporter NIPA-domain-containing protein [Gamsiella multidivaricata]KAI7823599.1 magnesium transporter NIPA-domain-containing protein [Gamsiella multidivaricata]